MLLRLIVFALALVSGAAAQAPSGDRIDQLIAQMTIEEKLSLLHGARDPESLGQMGYVPGVARLGIPALRVADGVAGIRVTQPATALPAPIALASTFAPDFARTFGQILARDGRARGQNVILAPMVNIVRVPQAGRNFETLGEDPLLASRMAAAEVEGIQRSGLVSAVRQFALSNQEQQRDTINAEADDRTIFEIELPAFEAAVRAGAGAIMAGQHKVNGTWVSESVPLLTDILRTQWKFAGFVMSDAAALHSGLPAFNAGLDVEMPVARQFESLTEAVKSGQLAESAVNTSVRRVLIGMDSAGLLNPANANRPAPGIPNVTAAARDIAAAGAVLLKNSRNALPLGKTARDTLAVIGAGAKTPLITAAGARVQPMRVITPHDAIHKWAPLVPITYAAGGNAINEAVTAAKAARTAVIFAQDEPRTGLDRTSLSLPGDQNALIQAVAAVNSRTVVILNTSGPVLMPWAGQVAAILQMWYPGQEGADATAAILTGDVSPGGRLPVTFPRRAEDAPTAAADRYPGVDGKSNYSEGIFVGYRWYDQQKIEPLFPFGHGLSYSEVDYSNFTVTPNGDGFDAKFTVRNKGLRETSDVPQIYVGSPSPAPVPMAARALAGFQRVILQPGQTQDVTIRVAARELSYWDAGSRSWVVAGGQRTVYLGASSRDIRGEQRVTIGGK